MTRNQVEALAKKIYGPKAFIEERPKALTSEGRAALREKLNAARERTKEIDAELKAIGSPWQRLTESARFALDVDGGEPSWSKLRAATEAAERFSELTEEKCGLPNFTRDGGGLHSYRWQMIEANGFFNVVHHSADSLDELAAKMQAKNPVPA